MSLNQSDSDLLVIAAVLARSVGIDAVSPDPEKLASLGVAIRAAGREVPDTEIVRLLRMSQRELLRRKMEDQE